MKSMVQTQSTVVRPAAVAGTFYPGSAQDLARTVRDLLARARATGPAPKAIIAPHAGYVYSGPIAASAYARLAPARGSIRRVVLLGPTHRVAVDSIALPGATAFETPLGRVPVDADAVALLTSLPQITISRAAHAHEHALEVHLPFLQQVLDAFSIVPLAVGDASAADVAEVVEKLWGGPETLIVASSDLSHYLPYRDAQAADRATADAILELRTGLTRDQACGATPVAGLAVAARRRNLAIELLDLRNSGDTAGDKRRVVGYGSFALVERGGHDRQG